jgi:hypothetical protein
MLRKWSLAKYLQKTVEPAMLSTTPIPVSIQARILIGAATG